MGLRIYNTPVKYYAGSLLTIMQLTTMSITLSLVQSMSFCHTTRYVSIWSNSAESTFTDINPISGNVATPGPPYPCLELLPRLPMHLQVLKLQIVDPDPEQERSNKRPYSLPGFSDKL
jgi:hypothetical protein